MVRLSAVVRVSRICLLIISIVLASFGLLHLVNVITLPVFPGLTRQRDRAESVSERSSSFDQKKILRALASNKVNGYYYRFDERLDEAVGSQIFPDSGASERPVSMPDLVKIEFSDSNNTPLVSSVGQPIIRHNRLFLVADRGNFLETREPINLQPSEIGEILVRLRVSRGKCMVLAWSVDNVHLNNLNVYTTPSTSDFYTYRIQARDFFCNTRQSETVDELSGWKLAIYPSDVPGDEIELEYIHFVSKRQKYQKQSCGTAYETLDSDTRPVLFMHPQQALTYSLVLPTGPLFFKTGLGLLFAESSVTCTVRLNSGDQSRVLFERTLEDSTTWHDLKIDVSDWADQHCDIVLETSAEGPGTIALWSNPIIYGLPTRKLNIIMVLEDALRADHLSLYGHPLKTSPFKDEFFNSSIRFAHAFSPETKTRPSCPSIMTSLHPTATGVWNFNELLADGYVTLAEVLRSQGFATASFCQNPNAGRGAGLHQGFCVNYDKRRIGERAQTAYGDLLSYWIANNCDRNMFIYIHIIDPHSPYDPPAPFDRFFQEGPPGTSTLKHDPYFDPASVRNVTVEGRRQLYDGEIAYNDHCFMQFVGTLSEHDILDSSCLVFLSDHGEHLGEHNLWEHSPPGFIQVTHVPLVFHYPALFNEARTITQPVQLVDVMPTLLELAEIPGGDFLMHGDSLLPLINDPTNEFFQSRVIISEEVMEKAGKEDRSEWASLFFQNWQIINSCSFHHLQWLPVSVSTRFYDYVKDPDELSFINRFYIDPFYKFKITRAINTVQAHNLKVWKNISRGEQQSIFYDPETSEQLKELGYLR